MENQTPAKALVTSRALWKVILFTIITLGFYSIFFYSHIRRDLNLICGNHNGDRTMSFWLLILIICPITLGIGMIVWFHKISARIGRELEVRQLSRSFGASDYWLWNVLGSLILVGPFIYVHKLCASMNALCEDYNKKC